MGGYRVNMGKFQHQSWCSEHGGKETYSLVKLGTGLSARGLSLLLVLLAPAGQLSLDLCGGLVDVGCAKGEDGLAKVEASRGH